MVVIIVDADGVVVDVVAVAWGGRGGRGSGWCHRWWWSRRLASPPFAVAKVATMVELVVVIVVVAGESDCGRRLRAEGARGRAGRAYI